MEDSSSLDSEAIAHLERVVVEYPHAAILQVLYAKALQNESSYLTSAQLKRAALTVSNRTALHQWLQPEESMDWSLQLPQEAKVSHKSRTVEEKKASEPVKMKTSAAPTAPPDAKPIEPEERKVTTPEPTKPIEPISKPAPAPTGATRTQLGDDLSHLPPKVREIIERSRKITQSYVHHEGDVDELEKRAAENGGTSDSSSDEVENHEFHETPAEDTPVQKAAEPEVEHLDMSEMSSAESYDTEGEAEEDIEAGEERTFAVPLVLDDLLGGDSLEGDSSRSPSEEIQGETPVAELDFAAWLKGLQDKKERGQEAAPVEEQPAKPVDVKPKPAKTERVQKRSANMDLIDKFIEEQPKITPPSRDFDKSERPKSIDVSAMGSEVGDDFVTETLAQVYKQQGALDKALSAYEILRLKYPEKSSFFADQISEIRRLLRKG